MKVLPRHSLGARAHDPHPVIQGGNPEDDAGAIVGDGLDYVCFDLQHGLGGFDSLVDPPSAKICSSLAMPPFDDVGVPPDVIAMYSLPSTM